MKSFVAVVAASFLIGQALAECPNACSGHGRCTNYAAQFSTHPEADIKIPTAYTATYGYSTATPKKDSCTCFSQLDSNGADVYAWKGADCSLRTCPYGPAHADTPSSDNVHTGHLECSGKGECDRKMGVCKCFNGYTGAGCKRTKCPNSCTGNGQCLPLKKIVADVAVLDGTLQYSVASAKYDSAFDAEVQYGCVCDSGRLGSDCSILACPSGADPMGGKGSEYGRPCSGRGACNEGACLCHTGYFGTKCEKQRGKSG